MASDVRSLLKDCSPRRFPPRITLGLHTYTCPRLSPTRAELFHLSLLVGQNSGHILPHLSLSLVVVIACGTGHLNGNLSKTSLDLGPVDLCLTTCRHAVCVVLLIPAHPCQDQLLLSLLIQQPRLVNGLRVQTGCLRHPSAAQ